MISEYNGIKHNYLPTFSTHLPPPLVPRSLPPPIQTGYNLVVCAYALGDRDAMRRSYQLLIKKAPEEVDEDDEEMEDDADDMNQLVQDDGLRDELRKRTGYITR